MLEELGWVDTVSPKPVKSFPFCFDFYFALFNFSLIVFYFNLILFVANFSSLFFLFFI